MLGRDCCLDDCALVDSVAAVVEVGEIRGVRIFLGVLLSVVISILREERVIRKPAPRYRVAGI